MLSDPGVPVVCQPATQMPSRQPAAESRAFGRTPGRSHMPSGSLFELLGAPRHPKTMFFLSKTMIFEVSTKPLLEVFCALFEAPGLHLGAQRLPEASQRTPKAPHRPPKDTKKMTKSMKNPLRAPPEHLWDPKGAPKEPPKDVQKDAKKSPKRIECWTPKFPNPL